MWGYLLWMTHTPTASFICERFISQDDTVICLSLCFVFFDMKKAVVEAGAGLRGTEGGTNMWPDQSLQGPVRPLRSSCPGLHGHPEVQLDGIGQLPAAVRQWGTLTCFITSFMMKAWACDGEPTQHTCTYYYVIFVVTLQQCKTITPINTGYISNSTHHLAFNTTNIIFFWFCGCFIKACPEPGYVAVSTSCDCSCHHLYIPNDLPSSSSNPAHSFVKQMLHGPMTFSFENSFPA